MPNLKSRIISFCGGKIQNFLSQWETLTSDPTILQTVKGEIIDFINAPPSSSVYPNNSISKDHVTKIDQEISSLMKKKIIVVSSHEPGEYISPIFSVPKKDNKVRLILNLKRLNEHVKSYHFKMDSIHTALSLVTEGCWMASLDLKDAYYSVRIHEAYQKFLKFSYKGTLFQYTVYPNGLSTCPRNFTKLLKPVLCVLRKQGHILIIFIDDILIIATSYEGCAKTILAAIKLLTSLGFVIHVDKSVFYPQKQIVFLGFEINSVTMKITLTREKIAKITTRIAELLASPTPTIREVAQVVGYLVSSFPAIRYGECHYRAIEHDKIIALKTAKGNFDSHMHLSPRAVRELNWWSVNLPNSFNLIETPPVDICLHSDASLSGWGGVMKSMSTGGHWTEHEAKQHINYLELMAAFFTLKCFINSVEGKHVKIMIDNTTAVSVINNKGTSHNEQCNDVACDIWNLCEENSIWLTAAYIPGKDNIIADRESRNKNVDTEWMLNPRFLKLALNYFNFLPCIDLFASRINKQFNTYVSYKPDPYAKHIDAFTITWSTEDFYCFPPFSCVTKVIRKIIQDKARGILVVPDWPTQTWYPMLLPILEQPPHRLQPSADLLIMPSQPNLKHPLHAKMNLLICLVSGKNYK